MPGDDDEQSKAMLAVASPDVPVVGSDAEDEPREKPAPLVRARSVRMAKKALPTLHDIERRLAKSDTFGEHKARFAVDPRGPFMRKWDLVMVGLLLYTATVTPYDIAFLPAADESVPVDNGLYWVNQLVNLMFLFDMILNCFLGFYDPIMGSWVFSNGRIFMRYLQGWLLIDLVSILPFELLGSLLGSSDLSSLKILRIIRLLRLIKLVRIFRASRLFKRFEVTMETSYAALALAKFLMLVFITMHWIACTWSIAAGLEDVGTSWVDAYNMREYTPAEMYMTCIYYAVIALPIGVGDIVPVTTLERIVTTLCMIVGGSVYAYVIGAVCGVVATQDPATTKFNQTMDHLNAFLTEVKAPMTKRREIREYFHYCRDLFRAEYYHDIIHLMSPKLRGDIARHCHSKWILSISFFCPKSPEERNTFVAAVALALKREAYAPKERIIQQGEFTEKMYIIQRGLAARLGLVMGAGRYFGEDVILHNCRRNYFVRVLTYLDVYSLSKHDLEDILDNGDFPETRRLIRSAAIKLSLSREMKRLSAQVRLARMLAANDADVTEEQKQAARDEAGADEGPVSRVHQHAADSEIVLRSLDEDQELCARLGTLESKLDNVLAQLHQLPLPVVEQDEEFDEEMLMNMSFASVVGSKAAGRPGSRPGSGRPPSSAAGGTGDGPARTSPRP